MKSVRYSGDNFMKHTKKYKNIFFNISLKYFNKGESFKFKLFQSENFM